MINDLFHVTIYSPFLKAQINANESFSSCRKLKQTGRMQDSMAKLSDVLGELLSSSDEDEMQPSKPQQKPAGDDKMY